MKADFDTAAKSYDETFTQSTIGQLQRQRVWKHLQEQLNKEKPLRILELNCGTGEDALFLARSGYHVTGTDISSEMIDICKAKAQQQRITSALTFQQIDINNIHSKLFDQSFDLIFSNFGGLNCLSQPELKNLFNSIKSILSDHGRMMIVVMPRFCLIESLFLFTKFRFSSMFRRNTANSLFVNVNGVDIKTFYYSPTDIIKLLDKSWTDHNVQSVGFIPSFLENKINAGNIISQTLFSIDKICYALNWSRVSDHFLLDVTLNKSVTI